MRTCLNLSIWRKHQGTDMVTSTVALLVASVTVIFPTFGFKCKNLALPVLERARTVANAL